MHHCCTQETQFLEHDITPSQLTLPPWCIPMNISWAIQTTLPSSLTSPCSNHNWKSPWRQPGWTNYIIQEKVQLFPSQNWEEHAYTHKKWSAQFGYHTTLPGLWSGEGNYNIDQQTAVFSVWRRKVWLKELTARICTLLPTTQRKVLLLHGHQIQSQAFWNNCWTRYSTALQSLVVTICTTKFNTKNYEFFLHTVYVFCVDLRPNSDYFPIQH